ncbi:MAG: hypothetical protein ACOYM8_15545, partial [Caulobacterales bacterium]
AGLIGVPLERVQALHRDRLANLQSEFEATASKVVARAKGRFAPSSDIRPTGHVWLHVLAKDLVAWAVAESVSEWEFEDQLERACRLVEDFAEALTGRREEAQFAGHLLQTVPERWPRQTVNREAFNDAVNAYLDLPVKPDVIDESLLYLGVGVEYLALRDFRRNAKAIRAEIEANGGDRSYLQSAELLQSPWQAILRPVWTRLRFYAVAALAAVIGRELGWLSPVAFEMVGYAGALIVIADALITLATLRQTIPLARVAGAKLDALLAEIEAILKVLRDERNISTDLIRERLLKAERDGIRWPTSLLPLANDIAKRRDRIRQYER